MKNLKKMYNLRKRFVDVTKTEEMVPQVKMKVNKRKSKMAQRDYRCDQCRKVFASPFGLRLHIQKVNHKSWDYKCDTCGSMFFQKENLKMHIKTVHGRRRDFKCDRCRKVFASPYGLRLHIQVHEKREDHKCETCGIFFCLNNRPKNAF